MRALFVGMVAAQVSKEQGGEEEGGEGGLATLVF
jgi:hypothetical protein